MSIGKGRTYSGHLVRLCCWYSERSGELTSSSQGVHRGTEAKEFEAESRHVTYRPTMPYRCILD